MPLVLYWTNDDTNALEFFQLDVVTSLSHDDTATITDHPVEEGVNIVDHARDDPERLSIEGMITNTPHAGNLTSDDSYSNQQLSLTVPIMNQSGTQTLKLDVPNPDLTPTVDSITSGIVGAIGSLITGGPQANMNNPATPGKRSTSVSIPQPSSPRDRARDAYEKLLAAKTAHDLITVDTGMRSYFDMLIERIGVPRAVEDGTSVKFEIDIRRLLIAESQTVAAPSPAEARGNANLSKGSQTPQDDPNEAAKEPPVSTLDQTLYGGN